MLTKLTSVIFAPLLILLIFLKRILKAIIDKVDNSSDCLFKILNENNDSKIKSKKILIGNFINSPPFPQSSNFTSMEKTQIKFNENFVSGYYH